MKVAGVETDQCECGARWVSFVQQPERDLAAEYAAGDFWQCLKPAQEFTATCENGHALRVEVPPQREEARSTMDPQKVLDAAKKVEREHDILVAELAAYQVAHRALELAQQGLDEVEQRVRAQRAEYGKAREALCEAVVEGQTPLPKGFLYEPDGFFAG